MLTGCAGGKEGLTVPDEVSADSGPEKQPEAPRMWTRGRKTTAVSFLVVILKRGFMLKLGNGT